jgi:outer membrane protein assembly factor BamB
MGSVLYRFNEKIEILEDTLEPVKIQTSAIVLGGEAIIDARSGNVTIVTSSTETQLQLTAQATTVIANKGNFWFGTDDGVTVVERTSDGSFVLQESVQLAGPIVQLIPLFDGGVAFVSEAGFVGIVEESQGEVALEQ